MGTAIETAGKMVGRDGTLSRLNDYFEMALKSQRPVILELYITGFRVRIGHGPEPES